MAVHSILSLASGGGGLDAGVAIALGGAARTVCYVENEVTAARALVAGMEAQLLDDAPIWSDLKTFDGRGWRGLVEGIIGGYPCQPFSVAGRRRGAGDPRHLWPYIADIVRAVEPRWCFFENVGGHLRLGFREVAEELRGMGYRVAATLWRAEEVGAPHRRERLFIMAHADRLRDERRRVARELGGAQGAEPSQARQWERDGHATDYRGETVVHAERTRWPQAGLGRDIDAGGEPQTRSRGAVGDADALGRRAQGHHGIPPEQPHLSAGGMGWPPGPSGDWGRVPQQLWPATPQPAVRRVADGAVLARTDWLRILGNGVVPEQAAAAFRELWEELT